MSKYNEVEIGIGSFVTSRHLLDSRFPECGYPFSDGLLKGKVLEINRNSFRVLTISHRELYRIGQICNAMKINCVEIYE